MDINFHFYAVKVIAMLAGFDPIESNRIASYSQYVDDYRPEKSYVLHQVPQFAGELVEDGRFQTVQTGFTVEGENTRFLDPIFLRDTVITFHFIPPVYKITGKEYQVKRAHCSDGSMASHILHNAAEEYRRSSRVEEKEAALLHIGIALHIFADTYAHENFNGFFSEQNVAEVVEAKINKVPMNPYHAFHNLPNVLAVGHAQVGTAPDDSYTWFKVRQNGREWERDNTEAFLECAREILDCLAYMKTKKRPDNYAVMNEILTAGFQETDSSNLPEAWRQAWNDNVQKPYPVEYFYYTQDWLNSVFRPFEVYIGTKKEWRANADFYYYNFYAKKIRDYVTHVIYEG